MAGQIPQTESQFDFLVKGGYRVPVKVRDAAQVKLKSNDYMRSFLHSLCVIGDYIRAHNQQR